MLKGSRAESTTRPKPITAQPPPDAIEFMADVQWLGRRGEAYNYKRRLPGCYWTPRRPAAQ